MRSFLSSRPEELHHAPALKFMDSGAPKCKENTTHMSLSQSMRADAARRQAVFVLLGPACPLNLYIKPNGELTNTDALCRAAYRLIEPGKIPFRDQIKAKFSWINNFTKLLGNEMRPTRGRMALTATTTALIGALTGPSILAAAQLATAAHVTRGALAAAYGYHRLDAAIEADKINSEKIRAAESNGIWSVTTISEMRLHLNSLRELDRSMKKIPETGSSMIQRAIRKRLKRARLFPAGSAYVDQTLRAYQEMLKAFVVTNKINESNSRGIEFRKLLLADPKISPMLRVFHFFDYRGYLRSRDATMKAFVIQENYAQQATMLLGRSINPQAADRELSFIGSPDRQQLALSAMS